MTNPTKDKDKPIFSEFSRLANAPFAISTLIPFPTQKAFGITLQSSKTNSFSLYKTSPLVKINALKTLEEFLSLTVLIGSVSTSEHLLYIQSNFFIRKENKTISKI